MEHLLTNITGLDALLCFALLLVYLWAGPSAADHRSRKKLDTGDVD